MSIEIGKLQKLTSPNPFALITTRKRNGKTNIMALSWWTYVSNKPSMLAICLSKKGYSGKLIKETGEFGLNLVGKEFMDVAMLCGRCSGCDVDKAEKFGIQLLEANSMKTKILKDAVATVECKLVNSIEASDHEIFIAEITDIVINNPEGEQLYAINGYSMLQSIELPK